MPHPSVSRTFGRSFICLLLVGPACGGGADASPTITSAETSAETAPPTLAVATVGLDPRSDEQWALDAIGAQAAWEVTDGAGVVIAVVDSGVDLSHPDLVDRLVPGWDFVDDDDRPDDPNGHGTHVAGIAAASSNGEGVVGVSPGASIMPLRVLDAEGAGSDEDIAAAIEWAVAHGADVVNLSLGDSGIVGRISKGGAINSAIRAASEAGVVVVAAAGNEGATGRQYRLGVDVLVVNAVDRDDTVADFSNVGDSRAISAPGVEILSTAPMRATTLWPEGTDGFATLDGTSMASPIVSGVAALALAAGTPPDEVIDRLIDTARPGDDPELGAGVVDAAAAVGLAPTVPRNAAPLPTTTSTSTSEPTSEPTTTSTSSVTSRPVATSIPTAPTSTTTRPPAGAGSLGVTISGPVDVGGTVPADVACSVTGRRYEVSVGRTSIEAEVSVAVELSVIGYTGPGDYPALGTITIDTPSTGAIELPIAAPATVASGGGSLAMTVETASAGTVGVELVWGCNP